MQTIPVKETAHETPLAFRAIHPNTARQFSEDQNRRFLYERQAGKLKSSPILFSRDVIARANKAEHICNLPYLVKLSLVFGFYRG